MFALDSLKKPNSSWKFYYLTLIGVAIQYIVYHSVFQCHSFRLDNCFFFKNGVDNLPNVFFFCFSACVLGCIQSSRIMIDFLFAVGKGGNKLLVGRS